MGILEYLRSRAWSLALLACLDALLALVLAHTGSGRDLVLLVVALVSAAWLCSLGVAFARERRFYDDLADMSRLLGNPRLVTDAVACPEFPEGRVAYDALAAMAKSAGDEAAEARRQVEDYRAYVETWVHEAKSPIAAARLMAENLRADPDAARRDPGRLVALDDELARVEGYVEQALFYARSESVERDYLVRRHDLRSLVSEALRANARALIAARVTPEMGEGLGLEVFCDDKWLVFVLGQLLQNSARYAREGAEGGARVAFSARLLDEGLASERVELLVADNGCGCSAADLPRVFERGFTGENGRTHRRSTGLGLWLVARLCAKMGLAVSADSREGEGFCVRLGFPTNKMHYFEG